MAEVRGVCDERFDAVRQALAESLDKDDVGASAAVYLDGEPVVDIWGGYADAARTVPWQRDTITNVFSTTKTMVALSVLLLADRGDLDFDAPVVRYWPEFGAAGKDGVLVRHVLAHTAGLPDFDRPLSGADLYDWDAVTARLAAQAPRWEPGTLAGYHSLTQGFVLGEVIRRITGRTPGAFFAADVAGPLGADFHIGLPAERQEQYRGVDQVLGASMRYGLGYAIFDRSVGWGGWGGSLVMVDLDAHMTVSYVMNQMLDQSAGDYRGLGIVMAAYESL